MLPIQLYFTHFKIAWLYDSRHFNMFYDIGPEHNLITYMYISCDVVVKKFLLGEKIGV